jgi:sterol desaturase/sphingolipid hydroxylase (fatty acid hydroxylase superfamily)
MNPDIRSHNQGGGENLGASTLPRGTVVSLDRGESPRIGPKGAGKSRRHLTASSKTPVPATQLSRPAFFADFYAYPAVSAALVVFAFASNSHRWFFLLSALIVGVAFWSLVEYMLHRYVLHHVTWVKKQHDVHHHDQTALVGTPTWFSMLVFIAFVTVPALLMTTVEVAACFTAGMMLGYLWYVTAHYGMHHWRIRPSGHLGRLRRRHALHHHFDDLGNFGVTSGFWDHIFRTNIKS